MGWGVSYAIVHIFSWELRTAGYDRYRGGEKQPQLEFRVCGRFGDTKHPCEVAISAERRCRLKSPKNGAKHGIIRRVPSAPPQSFRPGTNQAGRRHIAP